MTHTLTFNPEGDSGLSLGTGMAYNTILEYMENTGVGKLTTISIDLATLVRNVMAEKKEEFQIQDMVIEIDLLTNMLSRLITQFRKKITIQYFMADYRRGKTTGKLRELNPKSTPEYVACDGLLRAQVSLHGKHSAFEMNGVKVRVDLLDKFNTSIADWYLHCQRRISLAPSVICLTSSPIIMYNAYKIPFILIRSYNGGFRYRDELSQAVFGNAWQDVPFFEYTHTLFGDKKLFASVLSITIKKRIREQAIAQNWIKLSHSNITLKIKQIIKENTK